ncbi:MAG: adenylyltransferase/cytidyltransferase family protein [Parachlamydiaceae bacterium]|nr:adenylyltransferase/cytidyltransferase family protein [Parachlamydiaceae bacterium]
MKNLWSEEYLRKVISPNELEETVALLKNEGNTVATINGSFDLLHAGHLQILYEASQQANILIVALNTDASIQQYKGSERPIISLEYRMQLIAALEFVDHVTWFSEITPCEILERIQPNVHVNGAEYGLNCIEADVVKAHGGRIHIVELVPGLSTSKIVGKIGVLFNN